MIIQRCNDRAGPTPRIQCRSLDPSAAPLEIGLDGNPRRQPSADTPLVENDIVLSLLRKGPPRVVARGGSSHQLEGTIASVGPPRRVGGAAACASFSGAQRKHAR